MSENGNQKIRIRHDGGKVVVDFEVKKDPTSLDINAIAAFFEASYLASQDAHAAAAATAEQFSEELAAWVVHDEGSGHEFPQLRSVEEPLGEAINDEVQTKLGELLIPEELLSDSHHGVKFAGRLDGNWRSLTDEQKTRWNKLKHDIPKAHDNLNEARLLVRRYGDKNEDLVDLVERRQGKLATLIVAFETMVDEING